MCTCDLGTQMSSHLPGARWENVCVQLKRTEEMGWISKCSNWLDWQDKKWMGVHSHGQINPWWEPGEPFKITTNSLADPSWEKGDFTCRCKQLHTCYQYLIKMWLCQILEKFAFKIREFLAERPVIWNSGRENYKKHFLFRRGLGRWHMLLVTLQASTVTKCKLPKSGCARLEVVEMLKDWCKLWLPQHLWARSEIIGLTSG